MNDQVREIIRRAKAERWTFLDLGNSGLDQFPDELLELESLETLCLGGYNYDIDAGEWRESRNTGSQNIFPTLPEGLSRLANLTSLDLSGTGVSDVEPLSRLANLKRLYLGLPPGSNIEPLSRLANLKSLHLYCMRLSSVEPLGRLVNLTSLYLESIQLSDVEPLSRLANLTSLKLHSVQLSNIEPLGRLTNLTWLDLFSAQMSDIETLSRLTNLKSLDLSGAQNDVKPLSRLTNLKSLHLHGNRVIDVEPLGRLANLTSLDLHGTGVIDVEPLGRLANLTSLDLHGMGVKDVEPLSHLVNLTWLDLRNTQLSDVEPLGRLANLTWLNLSYTQLSDVEPLGRLTNLTWLNLSSTQLSDVEPLGSLVNLTWLDVSFTQLSDAEPLSRLVNLTSLHLTHTQLSDAEPLGRLTNLMSLDLSSTMVSDIEPLSRLAKLTSLRLDSVPFTDVEPLSRLANLTSLDLTHTQLSDVEPLSRLANLTSLDVDYTQLSDVKPLSRLVNLTSLDLGHTDVSDAEPLSHLAKLMWLDLGSTRVSDTEPLSRLTNLKRLYLDSTGVSNAEPLGRLANLTWLNLSYTQLSDVEPLGRLTNLTWLNLSYTQLSNVDPLGRLANLTDLDLAGCKLTQLPITLLELPRLKDLQLYGNPLGPTAILGTQQSSNCLNALRAHIEDCKQGTQSDRELKLIVIGNARVGKSSLIRRLIHNDFDPNESSTHGIRLERWSAEHSDGSAHVNVWDFGGQDIYHGTHSLFLKSRAVFLIVWDLDTELNPTGCYAEGDLQFEHLPLAYWLEYVRAISPGSTILVVQTKCDDGQGNAPPADVAGLPTLTFSASTGRHRDVLLAYLSQAFDNELTLAAAHTIGIGRWKIKQTIRGYQDADLACPTSERKYRFISHSHFMELCRREGDAISSPYELLRYLHNTGVVYYEPELFQGEIILDLRWAIDALYCIYSRNRTYRFLRRKHGRFRLSDLNDLCWEEDGYSQEEQNLFISFMQSCSICFRISDYGDHDPEYIAPELLPEHDDVKDDIKLRRDLANDDRSVQSRIQYFFLHPGTTRRLMSRIGRLFRERGAYWRDGLIFASSMYRAVARIDWCHKLPEDATRGEYEVEVWGDGRHELLNTLCAEIQRLHNGDMPVWEHVSVDAQRWIDVAKLPDANRIGRIITQCGQVIDVAPFRFLLDRDEMAQLNWQPDGNRDERVGADHETECQGPATEQATDEPITRMLSTRDRQLLAWFKSFAYTEHLQELFTFWCIGYADKEAILSEGDAKGWGALRKELTILRDNRNLAFITKKVGHNWVKGIVKSVEDVCKKHPFPAGFASSNGSSVEFRALRKTRGDMEEARWTKVAGKVWLLIDRFFEIQGIRPINEGEPR